MENLKCSQRQVVTKITKQRFSYSYDLRKILFVDRSVCYIVTLALIFFFHLIIEMRILKCTYIPYLYSFHTLTFRFSVCNSIVNFYQTHYLCKKDPPPTLKLPNTAVFQIETAAIFDGEYYRSCLWVIKGILGTIVFVCRKNKIAVESNLQIVKLNTMPLPLPSYILPDNK